MTDFESYDEVEPIRELYDNLFNDLELYSSSKVYEMKRQPKLYRKYGKKLDKLVGSLERDLTIHCRQLDMKLRDKKEIGQT